jgi:hypothetical protein
MIDNRMAMLRISACCLLLGVVAHVDAAPRDAEVAALLARNCLECHNASDHKGGLDLTRREAALKGGDNGVVLKPGDAAASELLTRIVDGEMPPKGRPALSPDETALLREWITGGAAWATDPIDPFLYTSERRAGYNWWSLQPVQKVEPPAVKNEKWPINDIDRFILARLEEAGLSPSSAADRRTLIRRVYFDLLGLPPAPEEVAQFVADEDPLAYERLVNRLLASPQYGVRWARHWLDVVRFGESQGFERNKFRPSAWKYRDFVVEALHSDLPYNDFVRWQLAGDVLRPDDPLAVIASGFLVLGPYDLTAYTNGTPDMQKFAREEELEGLVATVSQTFLGLTVNCARCHDHKFDPVTQKEFYQLSAALGGTYQGDERDGPKSDERIAELQTQIAQMAQPIKQATSTTQQELADRQARLESLVALLKGGPVHTTRPNQPGAWHVLARGDYRKPGDVVAPAGITSLGKASADWKLATDAPEPQRRLALAEWIASDTNPLTARVIVNRLWGHHFGASLVRTPNDLGFQGGRPSHPELLDWLAWQLMHPPEGQPAWSLKRLHKLMVMSATYRQQAQVTKEGLAADADNRLLWRRPRQRLEAETFRDAVLAVSGQLDRRLGGPGYRDYTVTSAGNNETYTVFEAVGPEFNRRTLYRTWLRTGTSPLLDALDCPDPSVATPRRSVTSTPLQALSLLNNKFMEHAAERFAERLRSEAADEAAQVRRAYALALAREPSAEEAAFAQRFAKEHGLAQLCLVLLNLNEFVYVD